MRTPVVGTPRVGRRLRGREPGRPAADKSDGSAASSGRGGAPGRFGLRAVWAALLGCVWWLVWVAAAGDMGRELIRDPHFQDGFVLMRPEPGRHQPYGTLAGVRADGTAVWDLDQWSSHYPLAADAPERLGPGVLRYANVAKAVWVARPGAAEADLTLAVQASREYGSRARRGGEPWVHLLVEQPIENPPALASLAAARLHVEARLQEARRLTTPDYSPSLHAAQFQIFFSLQNQNHESAGYGQYLWFGIPLYDDRQRSPPAFAAQDTGGTKMFIFTPAGSVFTAQSAHDRQWITVDTDLLPLLRQGLETAWSRGFLRGSQSLADYRIAGMNLGWEVPGTFDVSMRIRNLSLKVRSGP